MADEEESFLKKTNKFLKKWTGGDYYDRSTARVKKKFSEVAPKTADAVEKTTDFLARGAAYTEIPGALLGMAKKSPRAAADLVRDSKSARSAAASGPKPRAAKDVAVGSARANASKGPQPKSSSGTFSDKIKTARTADQGAKVSPGRYNPLPSGTTTKRIPSKKGPFPVKAAVGASAAGAGAAFLATKKQMGSGKAVEVRKAAGTETKAYDRKTVGDGGVRKTANKFERKAKDIPPSKAGPKKRIGGITGGWGVPGYVSKDAPGFKSSPKVGKSKTRIAFEKEFAANRKAGKKSFKFRDKVYTTKTK